MPGVITLLTDRKKPAPRCKVEFLADERMVIPQIMWRSVEGDLRAQREEIRQLECQAQKASQYYERHINTLQLELAAARQQVRQLQRTWDWQAFWRVFIATFIVALMVIIAAAWSGR